MCCKCKYTLIMSKIIKGHYMSIETSEGEKITMFHSTKLAKNYAEAVKKELKLKKGQFAYSIGKIVIN